MPEGQALLQHSICYTVMVFCVWIACTYFLTTIVRIFILRVAFNNLFIYATQVE